jgi:alpha-glucosidase
MQADPRSLLSLYRHLLTLRRTEPALTSGGYSPAGGGDNWFAYVREAGTRRLFVVLNFTAKPIKVRLPGRGRLVVSTHLDRAGQAVEVLNLRGDEGLVVDLL